MEIITVIAIMSIVIAMIFSFLVFNVDGLNYGSGQTKEQANLRMAALRITEEVRNSREIKLSTEGLSTGLDYEIYVEDSALVLDDGSSKVTLASEGMESVIFELKPYNSKYLLLVTLATKTNSLDTEILLNNILDVDENAFTTDDQVRRLGFGFNPPSDSS
jgi:type II secretory pathway pseudopilin PulG